MVFCKKIIAIIVIVFTILFYQSFNIEAKPAVTESNDKITQNEPEMMATPEETIPVETIEKKMSKWWWVAGGVLLVGIAAAAASGGGGGGGGDGTVSQQPPEDTNAGNVEVSW